jgi:hypothetical protein
VAIGVDHPLLGKLFYQYGRFSEVPMSANMAPPAVWRQAKLTPSQQPSV